MHACKTDRALHCFTWMIVKHNEAANFRERMAVHELMLFVLKRCTEKKKKEIIARTLIYLQLVTKVLSIRLSLIFSLQFFIIPFSFFFSFLERSISSLFFLLKENNMVCTQAVERKSSKQYYLTVKVSPR